MKSNKFPLFFLIFFEFGAILTFSQKGQLIFVQFADSLSLHTQSFF